MLKRIDLFRSITATEPGLDEMRIWSRGSAVDIEFFNPYKALPPECDYVDQARVSALQGLSGQLREGDVMLVGSDVEVPGSQHTAVERIHTVVREFGVSFLCYPRRMDIAITTGQLERASLEYAAWDGRLPKDYARDLAKHQSLIREALMSRYRLQV